MVTNGGQENLCNDVKIPKARNIKTCGLFHPVIDKVISAFEHIHVFNIVHLSYNQLILRSAFPKNFQVCLLVSSISIAVQLKTPLSESSMLVEVWARQVPRAQAEI